MQVKGSLGTPFHNALNEARRQGARWLRRHQMIDTAQATALRDRLRHALLDADRPMFDWHHPGGSMFAWGAAWVSSPDPSIGPKLPRPRDICDAHGGALTHRMVARAPLHIVARPFRAATTSPVEPRPPRLLWTPLHCIWRESPSQPWIWTTTHAVGGGEVQRRADGWLETSPAHVHEPVPAKPYLTQQVPLLEERDAWLSLVRAARDACRQDGLEKIVTARCSHRQLAPQWRFDLPSTLQVLSDDYPSCTTFALRWPTLPETFVGATPETLARLDGSTLHTIALAGTLAHPGSREALSNAYEALLASQKLRHEHDVVVRAIRDALVSLATHIHHSAQPELRVLANVVHLETPIQAKLRANAHLLDVIDALHPTPAVGGLPPRAALDWLATHEALDRGWYASPLGWMRADGSGHVVVGLRSAWMSHRTVRAYVGAGITAASIPEDEWDETQHKLEAIMTSLRTLPCQGEP